MTHFGTHLFGLPLAACRIPFSLGTGVLVLVRSILRGGNHQKLVVQVDWVCSKLRFESHSARYGPFLVWGSRRPMCTNSRAFGGRSGAVCGHIVELEDPRGPFGTGTSRCTWRVGTISLHLAVFISF